MTSAGQTAVTDSATEWTGHLGIPQPILCAIFKLIWGDPTLGRIRAVAQRVSFFYISSRRGQTGSDIDKRFSRKTTTAYALHDDVL